MPDAGVDAADVQAAVLERHASSGAALRGVNVAGAEFGAPQIEPTSSFSNRDPGTYDTAYHYDTQATFDYLAGRGVKLVRLPVRWERLQREPFAPLDAAEVARLRAALSRAGQAGSRCGRRPQLRWLLPLRRRPGCKARHREPRATGARLRRPLVPAQRLRGRRALRGRLRPDERAREPAFARRPGPGPHVGARIAGRRRRGASPRRTATWCSSPATSGRAPSAGPRPTRWRGSTIPPATSATRPTTTGTRTAPGATDAPTPRKWPTLGRAGMPTPLRRARPRPPPPHRCPRCWCRPQRTPQVPTRPASIMETSRRATNSWPSRASALLSARWVATATRCRIAPGH